MHLHCPHCRNPIEIVEVESREEITCPSCGSTFHLENESTTDWIPTETKLGKFELLENVGHGAFGTVYKARDTELDRIVAVKVPRAGHLPDSEDQDRFLREARSVAQLRHASIVSVHEVGREENLPFLVSDFVEGVTLADMLSSGQPAFREAARLTAEIADALDYAHQQGVIHRDVKPSNIMLSSVVRSGIRQNSGFGLNSGEFSYGPSTTDYHPMLMDFGLAKRDAGEITMTVDGQVLGTPAYMSPEQAKGESHQVDGRSDVYSLGVILYQMLTRELPFRGTTRMLLHQVLHDEPRPPRKLNDRIPRDMETICLKAMAKEPGRRYQSAGNLAADLRRFLAGEPIQARPVSGPERLWRWSRRNTAAAISTAVVALSLLTVAVGATIAAVLLNDLAGREHKAAGNERKARLNADDFRKAAEKAQKAAEISEKENRERLVRQYIAQGRKLLDQDNLLASLPWFVEALREDRDNPEREKLHRLRLGMVLGTCPQLVLQLSQPGEGIWDADFSPDGSHIVTAGFNGVVRAWDSFSGEPVTPPMKHEDRVSLGHFSKDGKWVISTCFDGTIRVWDAATGEPVSPFLQHGGKALGGASLSPDKSRIITGGDNNTAKIWEVKTGKLLTPPLRHQDRVHHVFFSPDGTRVLTCSNDGTARLWDPDTGKPLTPPMQHGARLNGGYFSPDGSLVATASDDFTARVWDARTGIETIPPLRHKAQVFTVDFSPDGKRIATASWDKTVRIWDTKTGRPVTPPMKHPDRVVGVSFSPDGRRVVTGGAFSTVHIWNTTSGQEVASPLQHSTEVWGAGYSADGHRILTICNDRVIRVWSLLPRNMPEIIEYKSKDPIVHADFSSDGRHVVTVDLSGKGFIGDLDQGRGVAVRFGQAKEVQHVEISPDDNYIATAHADGSARVWLASTGKPVSPPLKHMNRVQHVSFSPDGKKIVTASWDKTAQIWNTETAEPIGKPMQHGQRVQFAAFSPDGKRIVTTGGFGQGVRSKGEARVWDAATGEPVTPVLMHTDTVERAAFSPDGKRVITCSMNGLARIWDAETGRAATRYLGHSYRWAAFDSEGKRVVTAGHDGVARVWDTATGLALTPPMKHSQALQQAWFSPDDRMVIAVGLSREVMLWDAEMGEPLSAPLPHLNSVRNVHFDSEKRQLVTICMDGKSYRWPLVTDNRPVAELRQLAGLLSSHYIDARGGLVPGEAKSLAAAWKQLRPKYPKDLSCSQKDVVTWCDRKAKFCEKSRDWETAKTYLDYLISVQPEQVSYRQRRAKVFGKLDQPEKAFEDLSKIIELDAKNAEAWKARGFAYFEKREWDNAVADLSKAIDLGLDDKFLWNYRGVAHIELKQWKKAEADLTKAIGPAPESWKILLTRAWVYENLRQWKKAVGDLAKAKDLNPDDSKLLVVLACTRMKWHKELEKNKDSLTSGQQDQHKKLPDLALRDFQDARKAGFANLDKLEQDEELETLRSRDDFKKLVKELESQIKENSPRVENVTKLEGRLSKSDPKDTFPLTKKSPRKVHWVKLDVGRSYLVDLEGKFDPYLRIEDEDRKPLFYNDDIYLLDKNLNSRLVFTPSKSGVYRLIVTCYSFRLTGSYSLKINPFVKASRPLIIKGELTKTTKKSARGAYLKGYRIKLRAGMPFTIDLKSEQFDAKLSLYDSTGRIFINKNAGVSPDNRRHCRIDFTPKKSGDYIVLVTSKEPGKTGAFTLRVQAFALRKKGE